MTPITCEQFRTFIWGQDAIPGLDADETDDAINDHGNECDACEAWYDAQLDSVRDVVEHLGPHQRAILESLIEQVGTDYEVDGDLVQAYLIVTKQGHPAFRT